MATLGGPVTGTGFLLGTATDNTVNPTLSNRGDSLTVTIGSNTPTLIIGDLWDGIRAWFSGDYIYGGNGNDTIWGDTGTYNGIYSDSEAASRDSEYGGSDDIYGGKGNDWINAGSGGNNTFGGEGNDTIYDGVDSGDAWGGLGADRIYGGFGVDYLYGDGGADTLNGGEGGDHLYGDGSNAGATASTGAADKIYGGIGLDTIYGGHGADSIYGGSENDYIFGGYGSSGAVNDHDQIFGEAGNDTIYGADGNDTIRGGGDDDRILGEAGRDKLDGGKGSDTLEGGDAADQYIFSTAPAGTKDTIRYFEEIDRIALSKAVFTGIGATLTANEFRSVATDAGLSRSKLDADDRLIFVKSNETLWYDKDGRGSARAVEIAFVDLDSSSVVVDVSDFMLF